MSYRLEQHESIEDGIRRVAYEQVDKALAEIADPDLDDHETVHQVRKRCKKIRGLVRLVRPRFEDTYQRENAHYRDAARTLSDLRDSVAVLETVDELEERFGDQVRPPVFSSLREVLEEEKERLARDEQDVEARLDDFATRMREGRARIDGWDLGKPKQDHGWDRIAPGLRKTYRRARKRRADAWEEGSSEAFHEWRKRVKYHWYHCRLLRDAWEDPLDERADAAHDLSDHLGDDHDLAVLRRRLAADPERYGGAEALQPFLGLLDRRGAELLALARPLGEKLFAEKPKRFTRRMGRYWDAWKAAGERQHVDGATAVDEMLVADPPAEGGEEASEPA